MIYVDAAIWPYRGMMMCHMTTDPGNLEELHAMAVKLGVRRWFQAKSKLPHYDICKAKRAQAVRLGAEEISRNKLVDLMGAWKEQPMS